MKNIINLIRKSFGYKMVGFVAAGVLIMLYIIYSKSSNVPIEELSPMENVIIYTLESYKYSDKIHVLTRALNNNLDPALQSWFLNQLHKCQENVEYYSYNLNLLIANSEIYQHLSSELQKQVILNYYNPFLNAYISKKDYIIFIAQVIQHNCFVEEVYSTASVFDRKLLMPTITHINNIRTILGAIEPNLFYNAVQYIYDLGNITNKEKLDLLSEQVKNIQKLTSFAFIPENLDGSSVSNVIMNNDNLKIPEVIEIPKGFVSPLVKGVFVCMSVFVVSIPFLFGSTSVEHIPTLVDVCSNTSNVVSN